MPNELLLRTDLSGNVTQALINNNNVGELVSVTQALLRGALQGSLTLKFDSVSVEQIPLKVIEATFVGGESITVTISSALDTGNRFAYKYVAGGGSAVEPALGDVIQDAIPIINSTVTVLEGAEGDKYLLYELDDKNRVVGFLAHTLTVGEVIII